MDCTRGVVDSLKAVVSYSSELQVPKQEWYANWDKVAVVAIIAIAIAYTITKCMEMYFTYKQEQATTTSSRESNKREWEVEDRKQKQDAELRSMKLERLKALEKLDKKYTEVYNIELGIKVSEDTNNQTS